MPTYTTWSATKKHAEVTLFNSLWAGYYGSGTKCVLSDYSATAGKWYCEIEVVEDGGGIANQCNQYGIITDDSTYQNFNIGYTYAADGRKQNGGVLTAYGSSWTATDKIGIAVDLTAGKIWFSKNGVWQGGGDPAAGTGEAFSGISGTYYVFAGLQGQWNAWSQPRANFGASAFTYSVPSGFHAGFGTGFDDSTGDIAVSAPAITAQGYGNFYASPNITAFTARGYGNFCALPFMPVFRANLTGHDNMTHITSVAAANIPAFTAALAGTVSSISPQPGTILVGALPAIYGALYGGGEISLSMLKSSFASTGQVAVSASFNLPLALSFIASGVGVVAGDLAVQAQKMSFAGSGIRSVIATFDKSLVAAYTSTGVLGIIGNLDEALSFSHILEGSVGIIGNFSKELSLAYANTGIICITGNMAMLLNRSSDAIVAGIEPHGNGTFSLVFGFGAGGSQTSFRAMVLNLKNYGLTEYLNYNFNSMASFDGKSFGANTSGIYELTGDMDVSSEISWRIVTPRFDLETDGVRKRLRHAWIGYKSSGDLVLTVIQPDGEEYEYTAESTDIVDGGVRVKFGKGIRSRYVELELKNSANESLVLDKFRIFVEPTTKQR